MEFFTFSDMKRPVRLNESTRRFAFDSLNHKYGLDTKAVYAAMMDDVPGFETKSNIEKYNCCIREIAKQSRVRICPDEKLSGAATFGMAIDHLLPATYNGTEVFKSQSHLTIDYETVLKYGMNGIKERIEAGLLDKTLSIRQKEFLESALNCIESMRIWRERYLDELKGNPLYVENYKNLLKVPFEPAASFYEAVQSIWSVFSFVRLCGNWPGIGRLDVLLREYLENDLKNNKITLDEAREILSHLFIKGCEWVAGGDYGSGDAQHYQNIVLAGVDENGEEVTNEVTYLVLDILEEFNIGDFPTSVRLNKNSPEKLLKRVAEVMRHGGGTLAVYNEETVIEAMQAVGYSAEEARRFANDGCWEMQVPGKTNFGYIAFDGLTVLLNDTLHLDEAPAHFDNIEELKTAFFANLDKNVSWIFYDKFNEKGTPYVDETTPNTVISIFEEGCIDKALDYNAGGARYFVRSPHLGGAADIGNSLYAIDELCFKRKKVSFDELMKILKNNWQGEEALRQYVRNKISCYGNDDDDADKYTAEVADKFADIVLKYKTPENTFFVPGISTFGRQIEWGKHRSATPHGYEKGDVLAPNMGATPGSDLKGATALIKSYCKINLKKHTTGAALDLKLLPSSVKGNDGIEALIALMKGFVMLGGCFMQPDVISNEALKEAQKNPENYASLSVRVSGWNARFVTLNKQWQNMIIEKTSHGEM